MAEIVGFQIGGGIGEDIPPEIFEGDGVLGDIFELVFFDESSPFFVPESKRPEVSDAEFILELFANATRIIKQRQL